PSAEKKLPPLAFAPKPEIPRMPRGGSRGLAIMHANPIMCWFPRDDFVGVTFLQEMWCPSILAECLDDFREERGLQAESRKQRSEVGSQRSAWRDFCLRNLCLPLADRARQKARCVPHAALGPRQGFKAQIASGYPRSQRGRRSELGGQRSAGPISLTSDL